MPNQNGTGPNGQRPQTGRGLGFCGQKNNNSPQQNIEARGLGLRRDKKGMKRRGIFGCFANLWQNKKNN